MKISSLCDELSKYLKIKVSENLPNRWNFQLKKTELDYFVIETAFIDYSDARLIAINLLKWINENAVTDYRNSFFVDMRFKEINSNIFSGSLFNDKYSNISKIDRLKMILSFDEESVYKDFPSRKNGFISKSSLTFLINKHITNQVKNPRLYTIADTAKCGINLETLNDGFIRLQYIGGEGYETKAQRILEIISLFCISGWQSMTKKDLTEKEISRFNKAIDKIRIYQSSYSDYLTFKKIYPNIKLTVDLQSNEKTLISFYNIIRDSLYEFISNSEFDSGFEINYDSAFKTLQIKGAKIKGKFISKLELVDCEFDAGTYEACDFYNCKVKNSVLVRCNIYRESEVHKSKLLNSVVNRTSKLIDCQFYGTNGVMNGHMNGGFLFSGIGELAKIKDVKVIDYREIKSGFFVVGDQVIIPTKF